MHELNNLFNNFPKIILIAKCNLAKNANKYFLPLYIENLKYQVEKNPWGTNFSLLPKIRFKYIHNLRVGSRCRSKSKIICLKGAEAP